MMVTPAGTACLAANSWIDWDNTQESVVVAATEIWEDLYLYARTKPCKTFNEQITFLNEQVNWACSLRTVKVYAWLFGKQSITDGCDTYSSYWNMTSTQEQIKQQIDFCKQSLKIIEDGPQTREAFKKKMEENYAPDVLSGLRIFIGVRAGAKNVMRILPAVVSMVPALMQGGLMVKNLVPRQTMPSILTTLPWAYTVVVWVQYQVYYQIMNDWLFLIAALALSFCPMVYYIYSKYYDLHQPMCDQQSITITFRIWYYALLLALVTPYVMLVIYITWFNKFLTDTVYQATVGWLLNPSVGQILAFLSGTVMGYAYTLQAGIDWFVDELVLHHMALHAPLVIATTRDVDEARALAKQLQTQIDVDSIQDGTYVCGGLSDPDRIDPPKNGTWKHKAETYAISLQRKDFATLDAFAAHVREDKSIPSVLERGRAFFYKWHDYPDKWQGEEEEEDSFSPEMSPNSRMRQEMQHGQWYGQSPKSPNSQIGVSFDTISQQRPPSWGHSDIQMAVVRNRTSGLDSPSMTPASGRGMTAQTSQFSSTNMPASQPRLPYPIGTGTQHSQYGGQATPYSSGTPATPYSGATPATPYSANPATPYSTSNPAMQYSGATPYGTTTMNPNGAPLTPSSQQYPDHWNTPNTQGRF